jgi:hypothetical protein
VTVADAGRSIGIGQGAVAQLGERRFCKPEVTGSIPVSSTILLPALGPGGTARSGRREPRVAISPALRGRRFSHSPIPRVGDGLLGSLTIEIAAFFVLTKLYGQVTKSIQGMPRRGKAMKDVASCVKPRGVAKQTLIRGCPNGETHPGAARISSSESIG